LSASVDRTDGNLAFSKDIRDAILRAESGLLPQIIDKAIDKKESKSSVSVLESRCWLPRTYSHASILVAL